MQSYAYGFVVLYLDQVLPQFFKDLFKMYTYILQGSCAGTGQVHLTPAPVKCPVRYE